VNRLIESNKLPHLLFYGPPGTGKTSTILACARKMYGNNFSSMVLEVRVFGAKSEWVLLWIGVCLSVHFTWCS
jgi:DNA polymerase III delta prime subunit